MFNEVWKDIVGFEGLYEISSFGNVRRFDTKKLKATPLNQYGYPQVNLYKNGKAYLRRVHRLVAIAFIQNNYPDKHDCINHKDENPSNNHVNNLEWCDREYNNNYGGHNTKIAQSRSKPVLQFNLNGMLLKEWKSATEASKHLGIAQMSISSCCLRKPKYNTAGGFLWKFKNDNNPIIYKHGKKIIKYSTDGTIIEEYENITTACRKNNLSATSISNCVHERSKTAGGYKWKLKEK